MLRLRWWFGLAPIVTFAWLGCGSSSNDGGGGPASGGPVTSYTPKSCDYVVTIPDAAEDATMDAADVGSDPAPRHVHASWAGAAASTFAVNWSTGLDTRLSGVLYGTDQAAVTAADGAATGVTLQHGHTYTYGSSSPIYADQKARIHEAHVCGLDAGTTYYYKVGGPGHWSAVYDVATAPPAQTAAPFRFVVAGDSRGDPGTFAELEQKIQAEAPDFEIFTGDAVMTGANQTDWDAFFEATTGSFPVEDALARIPFMTVNGNHENLALNYFAQFAFPETHGEEYFSFDYANAHFVMLNDTVADSATIAKEADFMKADLDKVDRSKTPWVFAVHHKPLYTCSNHDPDATEVATFGAVYDQYNVDFVLNGHNHCYERSEPIRAGAAVAMGSGSIYVTAGGAGAPLYSTGSDCPLEHVTESTRGYVVIDIDGTKLDYRAVRLDGTEIEKLSLTK